MRDRAERREPAAIRRLRRAGPGLCGIDRRGQSEHTIQGRERRLLLTQGACAWQKQIRPAQHSDERERKVRGDLLFAVDILDWIVKRTWTNRVWVSIPVRICLTELPELFLGERAPQCAYNWKCDAVLQRSREVIIFGCQMGPSRPSLSAVRCSGAALDE